MPLSGYNYAFVYCVNPVKCHAFQDKLVLFLGAIRSRVLTDKDNTLKSFHPNTDRVKLLLDLIILSQAKQYFVINKTSLPAAFFITFICIKVLTDNKRAVGG